MKFLPYHTYTRASILDSMTSATKGKRKADNSHAELAGESLAKKAAITLSDDGDMELTDD